MRFFRQLVAANATAVKIVWNHFTGPRPLIQRSVVYDLLPQYPSWFTNSGHTAAKVRFLRKLRNEYSLDRVEECPYCKSNRFALLAKQERSGLPTSVALCLDCSLVVTNLRLNASALLDHYQKEYRDIERGERPDLHRFMFNLQASKGPFLWEFLQKAGVRLGPESSMLDIGCGEGGLLHWFSTQTPISRISGFELNKAAAAYGRQQGLDIHESVFSGSHEPYDLVVLEQVLEHLPSAGELLTAIANSQKIGAWLYIGVPGILNFPTGYGHNFIAYLQYAHMLHYCLHTLERQIIPYGYRLVLGDETVRALFQRTDEKPHHLSTAPVSADAILQLLLDSEKQFLQAGSHLRNHWPDYRAYSKLLLQSWFDRGAADTRTGS